MSERDEYLELLSHLKTNYQMQKRTRVKEILDGLQHAERKLITRLRELASNPGSIAKVEEVK